MSRLATQLKTLRAELALDPERRELRVALAAGRRTLRRLARAEDAEPLVQLLARLGAGQISADQAGAAISRDGVIASQVARSAALSFDGAQTGDVTIGDVAGGNIIKIYYGGPGEH